MRSYIGVAMGALLLAACAPAHADPVVDRPSPSPEQLPGIVEGLNDAGLRLYLASREDGENTAVSPVSIGFAFGMADAGATGGVKTTIEEFFGLPEFGGDLLSSFNTLDLALESEQEGKVLRIANRVFTDSAFEPREDYRLRLAKFFGAGSEPVPMATDAGAAARRINAWISGETNGLIKDLVKPEAFSEDSRLALANTVYMKADWDQPFEAEKTNDGEFALLDGSAVTVPLMHQPDAWGEAAIGDGWVAGTKPYVEGDTEMLVIVPDEGRFDEIEDGLAEVLGAVDGALTETTFELTLPVFTAASTTDLREVMEGRLGVDGMFGVVGFDGIGEDLYLDSATHGVKVVVDETGTEAAAATVLGMDGVSAEVRVDPIVVDADQPFIYVIRDTETRAIEFIGRVLDPS